MALTDIRRGERRSDTVRFEGHPPHSHDCPQFIYMVVGNALLTTRGDRIPLAEGEGVWLPAEREHALDLEPGAVVMGPFLANDAAPPDGRTRLVAAPAIRRLMTTLLSVSPRTAPEIAYFRHALTATLRSVTGQYFPLRSPHHPAAAAIARHATRSHATLRQLAQRHYISPRHVQRLFQEQTGLAFATWRTRARLNAAITRLQDGRGFDAALAASGFTTRAGLLKALSRECRVPLEELGKDPVAAIGTAQPGLPSAL